MKVIKKDQTWGTISVKPHSWTLFAGNTAKEEAEEKELLSVLEKVEEETHQAVIEQMIEAKKIEREEVEIKNKKEEILEVTKQQAQAQADAIITEAKQKAEAVKEEAFQKGVEGGAIEAEKRAEEKYSGLFSEEIAKLKNVEKALESSYQEIVKNTEDKVVKLALDIAKKIIKEDCKKKSPLITKMVREGLSRLSERVPVKIRLNPEQLPLVEKNKKKLIEEFNNAQTIELIADAGVIAGGCVLETASGSIDLRIDRQFNEIQRNLTGETREKNEFESDD
ncbi:MAG: hypothetical protein JXD21_02165 [Candidatus Omnitrophica bacterium]|nr:hypothetical protein [Candidatus Omnitrophota bacterium]